MNVTVGQVIGTAVATGVIGFVVWAVTVPLRWRSVTGLIASVVVTGPLAVLGGIGWALLLSQNDVAGPIAALVLALVAVFVAAVESGVAATRAYRRFRRANRALRASLGDLAAGGPPASPDDEPRRPLLAELETVRSELDEVARSVAAARARDQALDESRRQLIAWVSQDLHAPLAVLRAMADTATESPASPATLDPSPEHTATEGIRDEVDRLLSAVDDLFDLATAPSGSGARSLVVPRWEPALLSDVLGDAVAALSPLARLRGVGIHVVGATAMQVRMQGPAGEDLARQLLTVMVDAVRHSRPGSIAEILVAPDPHDASAVRIDLRPGATPPGSNPQDRSAATPMDDPADRLALTLPLCVPA